MPAGFLADISAAQAVFIAVATVLLGIFIYMRDDQPYKFRDYRAVILLYATLLFNMILCVYLGNTVSSAGPRSTFSAMAAVAHNELCVRVRAQGGTAEVELDVLLRFIGPCLLLYYYIMKNLQLNFIYSWQAAKLRKNNKNIDKITRFHRFRFILSFRTYLIGFVGVILFCLIPALFTLYGRNTFADAQGHNVYMTARCAWWEIPDQYVNPPDQSLLCDCVKLATPIEGGDVQGCTNGIMTVCNPSYTNRTEAEQQFCAICPPSLSTGSPSDECREVIGYQFYYPGECGWVKEYPYARYCTTGIFADRVGETLCATWNYIFLGVNLIVMYPLFGKRDEFGMIYVSAVPTPAVRRVFASLPDNFCKCMSSPRHNRRT